MKGAVVETWTQASEVLQARPELNPRPVHSRTKREVGKGNVNFSTPRALRGLRSGHGVESDCTFIFTMLLLLVEGLEVFAALSFDIVVAPVLVVVVVTRDRAARKVVVGVVLWLIVVGLSTWNVEHMQTIWTVWGSLWGSL